MDDKKTRRFISYLLKVNIFILGIFFPWLLFIGVFLFITWPSHTTFEITYWIFMIDFVLLFIYIVVSLVIRYFERKIWSEHGLYRLSKLVLIMFPLVLGILITYYYIILILRNLFCFSDIIDAIFFALVIVFLILFGKYMHKRNLLKAKFERKVFSLKTKASELSSIVKNIIEELMLQYDFQEISNLLKTKKTFLYVLQSKDTTIRIEDQPPAIYLGEIKSENRELIKKIQQKIDSKT